MDKKDEAKINNLSLSYRNCKEETDSKDMQDDCDKKMKNKKEESDNEMTEEGKSNNQIKDKKEQDDEKISHDE